MWEAIAANRRRSILLISLMGIVLVTLGFCIGAYAGSQLSALDRGEETGTVLKGGGVGAGVALILWLILWLVALYKGESILLKSARAREIGRADHPQLWNVVEEMTIASGLTHKPRVFLIEDPVPNAFAVGRNPETAAVAVTSGLLRLLDRDELQGVVAHEIAHVRNLDIRFMTIASVLVASVELISHGFLRGAVYGGGRRSRGSSRSGGNAYLLVILLVVMILSPIAVRMLYLACSRWREYLADASASRFTRYPEGLASALEKLAVHNAEVPSKQVSGSLAALYIVNPIEKMSLSSLFATHPPTEKRVKILRGMAGGAGYVDYAAALEKIEGRQLRLAALEAAAKKKERVAIREPFVQEIAGGVIAGGGVAGGGIAGAIVLAGGLAAGATAMGGVIERGRQVNDLVDRLAGYLIIPCPCGMRIKVPPAFQRESVPCSRCDRGHTIPAAQGPATETASADGDGAAQYERREEGWEAFRCTCGQTIQLGPDFPLDYTVCVKCERRIELRSK